MKCENPACENIVTEYTKRNKNILKRFCSTTCKCKHTSVTTRDKASETMLHIYADSGRKDEIQSRMRATCLKNHGVENPMQSPSIRDKVKNNMIEKHGVDHPMQLDINKNKVKSTLYARHGVEYPLQHPVFMEKARKTWIQTLGVENPSNSMLVIDKKKITNKISHGVEWPMQSESIREKAKQANLIKHGWANPANKHISYDTQLLYNDKEWLLKQNETKTLAQIGDELGVNKLIISRKFAKYNISPKHHFKSFFEKQVFEYVKSIYPNIIQNDRKQIKPYELDIWFPDLNMAIECNGRYFHQDQAKEQNKIDRCEAKGIDLYFIWDDEWNKDQENIKSHIYSLIFKK